MKTITLKSITNILLAQYNVPLLLVIVFLLLIYGLKKANTNDIDTVRMQCTRNVNYIDISNNSRYMVTNDDCNAIVHDLLTSNELFGINSINDTKFTPDGCVKKV